MNARVDGFAPTRHPLYKTWCGIVERCTNAKHTSFRYYGGRGIQVCERWRASFASFVSDVGSRPSDKHTIDRIRTDGDYEPSNVRWATALQQAANRRRSGPRVGAPKLVTCIAQIALREWIASVGMTQRGFAEAIGTPHPVVNVWLTGKARPEHHFRLAIERLAGIRATDWFTPDEAAIAFGSRIAVPPDGS